MLCAATQRAAFSNPGALDALPLWTRGGYSLSPIPWHAEVSVHLWTWEATPAQSDCNPARAGGSATDRRLQRRDQEPEPHGKSLLGKESSRPFGGSFPNSRPTPPTP